MGNVDFYIDYGIIDCWDRRTSAAERVDQADMPNAAGLAVEGGARWAANVVNRAVSWAE